MIVDEATIIVRSGKGGDGMVSFRRQKYVPKGGPDGGDGGDGGDVVFVADPQVETLLDFAGRHHWLAQNGGPGASTQRHGKKGDDLFVRVPPGTLVYDEQTGHLIVDMDLPNKEFIVASGGKGGFGNEHFKSATNQTPRQATPGEPGEQRTIKLELKLIADIGLVGMPNAGKSTLLARISKATPRIADYPFTTLQPQLGITQLPGDRRMVVADIPGLIENAHQGHGLGTRFLRHIERTQLLLHIVEAEPLDGSDPVENYRIVSHELASYTPRLAQKPQLVVLSKMDVMNNEADVSAAVDMVQEAFKQKVFPISAVTGKGIAELLEVCWERLKRMPRSEQGWQVDSESDGSEPGS